MSKHLKIIFISLLSFCLLSSPALAAKEEITLWHTNIYIDDKGEINISDTLTIQCNQDVVRRGWFRIFYPEFYVNGDRHFPIEYQFEKAFLDGEPHPLIIEKTESGGTKVRFVYKADSKEKELLPVGEHEFKIVYKVKGYRFDHGEYDDFVWHVTGFSWPLPIKTVQAYLQLPDLLEPKNILRGGFTGNPLNPNHDALVSRLHKKGVIYTTLETLPINTGVSITAKFPKGYVLYSEAKKGLLLPGATPEPTPEISVPSVAPDGSKRGLEISPKKPEEPEVSADGSKRGLTIGEDKVATEKPAVNEDGSRNGLVITAPKEPVKSETNPDGSKNGLEIGKPATATVAEAVKPTLDQSMFKAGSVTSLFSEVRLQKDGSALITDDILFSPAGDSQLGVSRLLPTEAVSASEKKVQLQPEVSLVLLDGEAASFTTGAASGGLNVLIYHSDYRPLTSGSHTATIQYKYNNAVLKQAENDLVLLAVSGNAGDLGIKLYNLTMHYPDLVLAKEVDTRLYADDEKVAGKITDESSIAASGRDLSVGGVISLEALLLKGFIK